MRLITPDSFSVAPQLIGKPLASPRRRAVAMGIDLLLVAILIQMGAALLGFAAAFMLWRFSGRSATGGVVKRGVRTTLRVAAALLIFVFVANYSMEFITDRTGNDDETDQAESSTAAPSSFDVDDLDLSAGDAVKLGGYALRLRSVADSMQARAVADSVVELVRRSEADPETMEELRSIAHNLVRDGDNGDVHQAIDRAFGFREAPADSIALRYAAAIESADTITAESLRVALRGKLAGAELNESQRTVRRLRSEVEALSKQLEHEKRGRGLRSFITATADDLGLGFGWMAVYFTGFLALWRGQTPGKRLMGIRVVRVNDKPMTWWIAFERFGGYAASATLGLLGFLQILWDRNRQGLHDKAAETLVLRSPSSQP
jgi:hypothetical protein